MENLRSINDGKLGLLWVVKLGAVATLMYTVFWGFWGYIFHKLAYA